jgi:hypothetical protein
MQYHRKPAFWITTAIFFIAYFAFFLLINSYHLIYQEQTQLFLFNRYYFSSFLIKVGGISSYSGAFFTQFYQNPFAAASVVTIAGFFLFLVSASILRHYRITGVVWPMIPVILIAALQCHLLYLLGSTIGLLISTFFFSIYISIKTDKFRFVTGSAGCTLLWIIAGGFGLLAFGLCIIHELLYNKNRNRFLAVIIYLMLAIIVPVLSVRLIYYVKGDAIWLSLIPFDLKKSLHPFIYAILLFFPLLIAFSRLWNILSKNDSLSEWNWKTIGAGIILIGSLSFYVFRYVYDVKTEMLLKIDHFVQQGEWKKVLESTFVYPGTNQLVLYYGNMAMYKTGQMGDKMFHLPQMGIHGLWLEWKRNEMTPFLGGELYYQLGYMSEAYRWAFESMEAMGENPRSIKRLVITSMVTGDTSLARHYINILDETLFYRKWAHHYQYLLNNPELLIHDKEIMEKKHFNLHSDVFADVNSQDIGLLQLLEDHPDNRMAFEYYMAQNLLDKNIDGFIAQLGRLRELGYSRIPVHYEEAMLVYMSHTDKDIAPEGYALSRETIGRLSGYLDIINKYGNDRKKAARMLYPEYGGTYWFYLNFINLTEKNETSVPEKR